MCGKPAKNEAGIAMLGGIKDLRGELGMIVDSLGKMATTMEQNNGTNKKSIHALKASLEKVGAV